MDSNEEHCKEINNMKKMRVLCLHGFRTSASFLHKQISKWDSSITEKLDMSFLDGPFPAGEKSDIEGIFPPYYEWFQFNKDFTDYNPDKGLSFIVEYMEKNGPFDGLLGFSQGALLSAALVGFQMKGVMLKNHPPIRFVICISGSKFNDPSLCELPYSEPIKCPSVHLIGAKDWLKERGEELMQAFEKPLLIRHPQGHTVPRLGITTVLNPISISQDFTDYNPDKGLSFIVEYMEKNGPFDGLLGFSQGALLSAALVGFQMKGVMLKNHPPIRFVICISGSKFNDPSLCELPYSEPIKCPSVHLIGAKDWLKERGEELMQAFEKPLLIRHPQGHTVPRLDGEAVNLLNRFIDGLETTDITHKHENERIIENSRKYLLRLINLKLKIKSGVDK
eukprot:Gb_39256 [translate_table: standard]